MKIFVSTLAACGLALCLTGCGSQDSSTTPLSANPSVTALTDVTSVAPTPSAASSAQTSGVPLGTIRPVDASQGGTPEDFSLQPLGEAAPRPIVASNEVANSITNVKVHYDISYDRDNSSNIHLVGDIAALPPGNFVLNPSPDNPNYLDAKVDANSNGASARMELIWGDGGQMHPGAAISLGYVSPHSAVKLADKSGNWVIVVGFLSVNQLTAHSLSMSATGDLQAIGRYASGSMHSTFRFDY